MKEQAEKLRQELGPKIQEELEKSREKLQQEMEEFHLQIRGGSFDI